LRARSFAHTIRFVAVTGEELGLWGSAHYAAEAAARGERIAGVFNLDMIGYDSDGDHAMELHAGADPASIALADAFVANTQRYGIHLAADQYTITATRQSDHASFWNQGYPAILLIESYFGQDTNPHYHRLTDTVEQINLPYLADFVKASIATLAELAQMWQSPIWIPLLSCEP
jgi:Zn-dependent M28 family amino/carboxypeptidase